MKGLFGNSDWMTPERAMGFRAAGTALSQLGSGQAVNLSPLHKEVEARKEKAAMREAMQAPGVLDRFSPQQQAVLASMPPALAQKVIFAEMFKAPAAPTKGIAVGGNVVNPITGEVIYQSEQEGQTTGYIATGERAAALGLDPSNSYNITSGPEGMKATQIGGGGVTVNNAPQGPDFGSPPKDHVWARDENGDIQMESVDIGGTMVQRPVSVPLRGTAADQTARDVTRGQVSKIDSAGQFIGAIDEIMQHPALESATGLMAWTQSVPGTPMYDFGARMEQIEGKVFKEAIDALRGLGTMTEAEGRAASAAFSRLKSGLAPKDFLAAATELREVVGRALAQAQAQADGGAKALTDDQLMDIYK